jgi:hypothetical protein
VSCLVLSLFLSLEAHVDWAVNVSLPTFTTRAHTQVSFPLSLSFSLVYFHLLFSICSYPSVEALLDWALNVSFASCTSCAHDHQVSISLFLSFSLSLYLSFSCVLDLICVEQPWRKSNVLDFNNYVS